MEKELLNSGKELLLKDLCARLPYGVKCSFGVDDTVYEITGINPTCCGASEIQATHIKSSINGDFRLNSCKPYLFPLSSMTEEQLNDFYATIRPVIEEALDAYKDDKTEYEGERPITLKDIKTDIVAVNWMLKNHFDMNGLIPMGLAVDAIGLNIY